MQAPRPTARGGLKPGGGYDRPPIGSIIMTARSGPTTRERSLVPSRKRPSGSQEAGRARLLPRALLELDAGAGALELRLGLLRLFLGDLLEHRLRRRVHEVLGLLQPEARERPDLLDDLDLLVAGRLEDDVELVLLLGGGGLAATTARARRRGDRDRSGGGHAELLFERLQEVVQ